MSNETGNFVPQGLGGDNRNFFDDPLVGVEIKGQLCVVPRNEKQTYRVFCRKLGKRQSQYKWNYFNYSIFSRKTCTTKQVHFKSVNLGHMQKNMNYIM